MKKLAIIIFVSLAISACQNYNSGSKTDNSDLAIENLSLTEEKSASPVTEKTLANNNQVIYKHNIKLIKKGSIGFEVKEMDKAEQTINSLIQQYNCYISQDDIHNYAYGKERKIVLRIANNEFDRFIAQLTKGIAKPKYLRIETTDVSEEYVDIQARLKAKQETKKRFSQILGKARKINEILNIEREISEIQSEIERMEGRLKFLNNRINFSTLNINISQNIKPVETQKHNRFVQAIINGWQVVVEFILLIINVWPFIIIGGGIFWLIKKKRLTPKN